MVNGIQARMLFLQDNYVVVTWDAFPSLCLPIIDNAIRLKIFDARPFFSDTQTRTSNIDLDSLFRKSVFDSKVLWTNALLWHYRRCNHEDLKNLYNVVALSHHVIICECSMRNFKYDSLGLFCNIRKILLQADAFARNFGYIISMFFSEVTYDQSTCWSCDFQR